MNENVREAYSNLSLNSHSGNRSRSKITRSTGTTTTTCTNVAETVKAISQISQRKCERFFK